MAGRDGRTTGAYAALGATSPLYDQMMTCSTPLGAALSLAVWKIGPRQNEAYLQAALAGVPAGFDGDLLEVPVGTGVLTMPLYQTLPAARVTCLDASAEMLGVARARAAEAGLTNVDFVVGDVCDLPFEDESLDCVLSLNGFHAFPAKEHAWRECRRVLTPGGTFCGCTYVVGEEPLTDWWVTHVHEPLGFFSRPFETRASLTRRLERMYATVEVSTTRAIACFRCTA